MSDLLQKLATAIVWPIYVGQSESPAAAMARQIGDEGDDEVIKEIDGLIGRGVISIGALEPDDLNYDPRSSRPTPLVHRCTLVG